MTVGEMIGLNVEPEDEALAWERIRTSGLRRRMERLARNLRDAAGCALAFGLGDQSRYVPGGLGWMPLDEYWGANLTGRAAPGWER